MDWNEVMNAKSVEELKQAKLWLFQENIRIQNEKNAIDEMQEVHGFWQEDGSILYKGNVYYKSQTLIDINYDVMGSNKMVVITNDDVPVLLSETFGTKYFITKY